MRRVVKRLCFLPMAGTTGTVTRIVSSLGLCLWQRTGGRLSRWTTGGIGIYRNWGRSRQQSKRQNDPDQNRQAYLPVISSDILLPSLEQRNLD